MKVGRNAPCPCGSGRKFKHCHGAERGSERVRAEMLDALEEALDLGAVFPFLRPDDAALAAFAERAADELGDDDDDVPPEAVEEGLALLDDAERRRLVEDYARRHPDPWAEVCESIGDRALAERTLVAGAVRAAIRDRRLPPRGVLEEVERNEDVIDSSAAVLAFLLQPSGVWSLLDLFAAAEAAGSLRPGSREWIAAVDDLAYARTGDEQEGRVRELASYLERRLPLEGLPRLSALLAQACDEVRHDDALAHELAVVLLSQYLVFASSEAYVAASRN